MNNVIQQANGLWIPETQKSRQEIEDEARILFRKEHAACPKCGKGDIERTCMGHWSEPGKPYWDTNFASCSCGWRGRVFELVEKK
mgnify:CR=1 FL=1